MNPLEMAGEVIDEAAGDDWQTAATCKGLLEGYHERWYSSQQDMDLLSVEQTFTAPLTNLETGQESRTYRLAGKIDKLANDTRSRFVIDHKTTSQDIEDLDGTYWRQLVVEGQPLHYELLLLANGIRIERVVWDVIRKPGIRPKKLSKADLKAVTDTGVYCGEHVSEETRATISGSGRENGELYQIRLAADCREKPERYFQRRSIPHLRDELAEYAQELWDIGQEVRLCRNTKRHYRNSGACMLYGSPCKFLGICSGHDTPDSDRWEQKDFVHNELGEMDDARSVLTNSRLRCFQTCRRKHYYEYELGIRRVEEVESEALRFGSLFHLALDAWWMVIAKERQGHEDCTEESPTIAVGNSSGSTAKLAEGNSDGR